MVNAPPELDGLYDHREQRAEPLVPLRRARSYERELQTWLDPNVASAATDERFVDARNLLFVDNLQHRHRAGPDHHGRRVEPPGYLGLDFAARYEQYADLLRRQQAERQQHVAVLERYQLQQQQLAQAQAQAQAQAHAIAQARAQAVQARNAGSQPRRTEPHHRVYILRCSHCDTFLSDRGMRAVLLLRPQITLFSTDASPTNCGPLYPEHDEGVAEPEEKVERTCECLTQSLGCYTCGNVCGYHIIAPCSRCTASVSKHQRPANGHRFVFHHNEVSHSERKYVPGEAGVRTDLIRHVSSHSSDQATQTLIEHRNDFERMPLDTDSKDVRERPPHALSTDRDPSPHRSALNRSPAGLAEGDTVYWHYLVTSGELRKPVDPRSRVSTIFSAGR